MLLPLAHPRIGPDRTFAVGKLGHLGWPGFVPRAAGFFSAFITPPQPFAEAER
jgi:hypothetical protein